MPFPYFAKMRKIAANFNKTKLDFVPQKRSLWTNSLKFAGCCKIVSSDCPGLQMGSRKLLRNQMTACYFFNGAWFFLLHFKYPVFTVLVVIFLSFINILANGNISLFSSVNLAIFLKLIISENTPKKFFVSTHKKTHTLPSNLYYCTHRVGRVISFFTSRRNWDSPTPHPQASVPPPLWFRGEGPGAHSIAGKGWGSPNSDKGT